METSRRSTLPLWICDPLGGNKLGIECPRCGGKAIVARRKWLEIREEFIGRSCTYCFTTNRIPEGLR